MASSIDSLRYGFLIVELSTRSTERPKHLLHGLQQSKIGRSVSSHRQLLELHKEVQVAVARMVQAGCGGPEQVKPPYAILKTEAFQFVYALLNC